LIQSAGEERLRQPGIDGLEVLEAPERARDAHGDYGGHEATGRDPAMQDAVVGFAPVEFDAVVQKEKRKRGK
jgi:hypothetical protein